MNDMITGVCPGCGTVHMITSDHPLTQDEAGEEAKRLCKCEAGVAVRARMDAEQRILDMRGQGMDGITDTQASALIKLTEPIFANEFSRVSLVSQSYLPDKGVCKMTITIKRNGVRLDIKRKITYEPITQPET